MTRSSRTSLLQPGASDSISSEAISADEGAIARLCANYIDNVRAFTLKEKVKNRYTGRNEEPDERLMRSIEEKIDIAENRKEDFRREIMNFIGALAIGYAARKLGWLPAELSARITRFAMTWLQPALVALLAARSRSVRRRGARRLRLGDR